MTKQFYLDGEPVSASAAKAAFFAITQFWAEREEMQAIWNRGLQNTEDGEAARDCWPTEVELSFKDWD